jgi:ATP-binding cassette ChvD family protein
MNADYVFSLGHLRKAYGRKVVLDDVNLAFLRGARIGVIGHNGSGKSTLLRVLAGAETEYEGVCLPAKDITIGYLPQEPDLTPGTVRENLEEAVDEVRSLLTRFDTLNEKLAQDLDPDEMQKVLDELETVQTGIDHTDAWELDHRLEQASHALGLPPDDADVSRLSGGERRRVALCKILLRHPDVLLLDEPTNHLDADAVYWLENHLDAYEGTVISITHDRYFLDNVAQWMLEMDHGKAHPYKGNYSTYLGQRAKREHEADAQSKARKKRLDRELEWINTNPKGRLAKSKARIRDYEKLYREHQATSNSSNAFVLRIPVTEKLGRKVLHASGVSKGFGDREVLRDVTFEVPQGAVVGVIGPNGTGKTTLLKLIAGQLEPDAGTIDLGPSVRLCHVDQDRADLDPEKTVWQEITDGADEIELGKQKINSRAYVSRFNFRGSDQQQKVGTLSGGQRNRVQLAKMLRRGGNLLLVDEPTNDLDVSTIRVLEEALEGYAGSAIVVSHDRFFLDRVATHILAFEGDCTARFWDGNYATYHERREQELEATGATPERKGTHRRLR